MPGKYNVSLELRLHPSKLQFMANELPKRVRALKESPTHPDDPLKRSTGFWEETSMLSFLSLILFGLVVGVIAKLLMPGRDPGGFIITILLGIAGAVLGGYVGRLMGFYGPNEGAGFFMALLGSILLLAIYRMTLSRRVV